ncbi:glycosyltransferase [Acinetobacter lwoffii]|jgi:glycosyltransferase involved in cell wall biosynthesis|uniref:glycosyltransferase n=2 Tax=Acinetobacter lwoffii TaxID=28090 RepID=UPI000E14D043|nr:glycosyltransferase [Acinetobacter lwoffii]GEA63695.1 amylovoran biosynthesis protein AmsE [Acinetobacter lwoffii]SUU34142.1 glycosyltransferase [Acinetobacter lwoffii]VFQ35535.1 glycosyltransferase [Acinetobacter lwoffii]
MINFSVLMSLYYKEKKDFLDSSLVSIWSTQILKPNEIVIVLDGPVDYELQECIATWQNKIESVLKIVPLQKNIGLGKALNEGLKHCSYEWVFRMDTDDICTPDRFQKQVDFIMSNPDTVLFGGQVLEFDQNPDDSAVIKTVPTTHEDIKKFAKNRCPFNHMTVAYKKSVIMKLGGYQHHLFMEDYNLWLRIIGAGYEVANLEDVVLYARVGNGMHARRKGYEYVKSEKQLLNLKKELKIQNPIHANILFLIRSAFRLMPSSLLGKIYNTFLRKKVHK